MAAMACGINGSEISENNENEMKYKWRRGENDGNRRKMKRININKRDMAGEMAIKRRQ
jgi:hypothetical protein